MERVLIITTRFPFECEGACQQDRAHGPVLMKEDGHEVSVIAMGYERHQELAKKYEATLGFKITPILYERSTEKKKPLHRKIKQVLNPFNWDGAAFEYTRTDIHEVIEKEIARFKPTVVWCDYSNLWQLYPIIKAHKLPIITRSINYEAAHFWNSLPHTPLNWLRYQSKKLGEKRMLQTTDYLFSITPKEKFTYQDIYPHTPVTCLPLRRLGKYIGKYSRPIINRDTYNIFFMGSNYQIAHMYGALKFIVEEMNPLLQKTYPGTFKIHFIGSRMPAEIATKIKNGDYENVQYHGFVEDLDAFLGEMDIAISASLFGEGMQQKIFEPILRGIPTITNERGLAGYPFFDNVHVRTAEPTAESYVSILGDMRNAETRKKLSSRALKMAEELFDEAILKQLMNNAFQRVTQKDR